MADFSTRKTTDNADGGPDFVVQPNCSVCGGKSQLTVFECTNTYTGAVEFGAASDFSGYDKQGNPNWKIRPTYRLNMGYGFCADCYIGKPKRRMSGAKPDAARAWRWAIGFHGSDAFPSISATDEEVERFSTLVNQEAKERENPEAINARIWREDIWGCTRDQAVKRYVRPIDTMAGIRIAAGANA